jgi:hypothetical protein
MQATQGDGDVPAVAIVTLTVVTAAIHFSRAVVDPEIRVLFLLNGLGYLGLLVALYEPPPVLRPRRWLMRRVLIGYTLLTIVLFFVWGMMSGEWPLVGLVDKAIEVTLLVLLWHADRQASLSALPSR